MFLLQNGGQLNYQLAAGSGMALLIAGNDTSGIGISAILAVLSLFPEVLEKIRAEQQEVRGPQGAGGTCNVCHNSRACTANIVQRELPVVGVA